MTMNPLLLADVSPSLRWRALVELDGVPPDDADAAAAHAALRSSAEVASVVAQLSTDPDARTAGYLLCRLMYLGYDGPEVDRFVEHVFAQQQADGSWPLSFAPPDPKPAKRRRNQSPPRPAGEGYEMMPIQTSLPLRGVAAAGYATDPRAERAYDWLISKRLDDGSWPGDTKADLGVGGKVGGRTPGYRRLPRGNGCRAATTGAMACFALHPERRMSPPAHDALDHLLARETRDEWSLGWEVSRLTGFEKASGRLTFYATFDLAFLLDLASRSDVSLDDDRVADLIAFLETLRGPFGLWEHPAHPQLSRWLTFDIELSLRRFEAARTWTGSTERVSFTPYPKQRRRY